MNVIRNVYNQYRYNEAAVETIKGLPWWVYFLFTGSSVFLTRKRVADQVEDDKKAMWWAAGLGALEIFFVLYRIPEKKFPAITGAVSGFFLFDHLENKKKEAAATTSTSSASTTGTTTKVTEITTKDGTIYKMQIPTNILIVQNDRIKRLKFNVYSEESRLYYKDDRINLVEMSKDELKNFVETANKNGEKITVVSDNSTLNVSSQTELKTLEADTTGFTWICKASDGEVKEYIDQTFEKFFECLKI